jgi:biopolymer transport protein ExbD
MAGGGAQKGDGPKRARIEIIPLIDVIFFLLATFVLFTLSLNKSNGLSVSLPSTKNSVPRDPSNTVTISITEEDTIGWEKDQITLQEFVQRLASRVAEVGPQNAVFLVNADENAKYSSARYVFEQISNAGVTKVMVETRIMGQDEEIF